MTAQLVLPASVREALLASAREGTPEEVCGALVGDADARPIRVRGARPVENVADDPRTRYEFDPAEALETIDAAEAAGEDLVGFYHSHPRGPAELSATDRAEAAWPGRVYCLVVPGRAGGDEGGDATADGTVRAWRWTGEAFDPLSVAVETET